jgi:glycosyltransferase involved in cell wall biosynthesis
MARALRKQIASFDLVHLREYRSFQAALVHRYATKKNVPYILQAHGSLPRVIEKQNLKRVFDEIVGFKLLSDAALIVALTELESNQAKLMGVREHRIKIIPNAIDLEDYRSLPEAGVFRNKYGLSEKDRVILFLGRIHKVKGIDLLLQAFLALSIELANAKLVIAGPDEDGSSSVLQKKAKDMRISDRVIFPGPLYGRAKLEAYVDADVYVLPSKYETFPNTVLEAAACGTPVILTDRCGIAETFRKYGLVVGHDVNQLRDALLSVLKDDTKRHQLAQEGRELVQREFRWDKVMKEIEKTYSDVAGQATSADRREN